MANEIIFHEFRPLFLTLHRIGPFQNAPYEVDFTDKQNRPCNFFLLTSKNGLGKTIVLDTLSCLLSLLGQTEPKEYGLEDLDRGTGRAQLDLKLRVYWQGLDHHLVLSILGGDLSNDLSLKVWSNDDLNSHGTSKWHRIGFIGQHSGLPLKPLSTHKGDDFIGDLLATIQFNIGSSPSSFGESTFSYPTTLNFSAYRDIPQISAAREIAQPRSITRPQYWGYNPVHSFSAHNETWTYSLDNLLVWLKWLEGGRFEKACEYINKHVFDGSSKFLKDVDRPTLEAIIRTGDNEPSEHRLDRLSSGEKNLMQLFLRIGAHQTKNTILLIDEFDVHLHIRWQYRLYNALKALALRDDTNFTVIASTHSTEILQTFADTMDIEEYGLIKGGHLIKQDME
ncbi:AAA ATPase [Methylomonas albis]|uniref:AAA family ATPase n=1 Tax=Methylomonas albis TaxID=1854563 RepID=A0ABR9D6U6_9GAMM|nr:AAA family ATPase [Methylomonas albis]MBD9358847.1 AAA family ATPase [Methylomonas albis]CAD6882312.1 AAA ATPase [Methylomonas albis]